MCLRCCKLSLLRAYLPPDPDDTPLGTQVGITRGCTPSDPQGLPVLTLMACPYPLPGVARGRQAGSGQAAHGQGAQAEAQDAGRRGGGRGWEGSVRLEEGAEKVDRQQDSKKLNPPRFLTLVCTCLAGFHSKFSIVMGRRKPLCGGHGVAVVTRPQRRGARICGWHRAALLRGRAC